MQHPFSQLAVLSHEVGTGSTAQSSGLVEGMFWQIAPSVVLKQHAQDTSKSRLFFGLSGISGSFKTTFLQLTDEQSAQARL
jgi:hypothetical protein